jgi:signal transduction histidine kinase
MKSGVVSRLPIGVKLPLAAGGLVLIVGLVLSGASYTAVRRITLQNAEERLAPLTEQLATTYSAGVTALATRLRATADHPAVARYLSSPTEANRAQALEALQPSAPADSLVMANELRDGDERVLLAAGRDPARIAAAARPEWIPAPDEQGKSVVFGGFRQLADSVIVVPAVATVGAAPKIRLVQWRRTSIAPTGQQAIARIIGSEARLLFGNADGSLWTDFRGVVAAPPVDPSVMQGLLRYTRPGQEAVIASAQPVIGAPWTFAVEFPVRAVIAPVNAFLRTMAGIAAACLTLGLVLAWLLSRRLTAPLGQLTEAADAIAGGDHTRRAGLAREDELGRLGASFDSMAAQIGESRQRLEDKVHSRTSELNEALLRLQEAQQALIRREKLALLGQLASGVGHELRNPLGVMSNSVYYLDAVLHDAPEKVRTSLKMLREQIALSAKIVNDLLDFSRITPAERLPVPLAHLAETQLRRLPSHERIRITREFPDGLPLAHVDPVHAGQILYNLLTNAVEAMGESGTLHLRGRVDPEGQLLLEVTDTGPGIAPEHLEKIFEPLFTTKSDGIGLGLAVSKSLAQANGGDLAVSSRPGAGATFAFLMPIAT